MFVPPINLGQFQPSPATLADWIYQIWNYLQNNPIATQEQLQEYIATFITTSPETREIIGEGVEQYLTDNPPEAPVQSVQGKTGAVTLAFNDILKNNNTAPVYRAASMPSQSTLQAQYNLGYRLFVNTTTQEIYSITNTGTTTLVGKGKFDGTTVDLNTAQGDTTIAEAINDLKPDTAFITNSAAGSAGNYVSIASYTAPSDGIYQCDVVARFNSSNTGSNRELGIRLNVNGEDYSPVFYATLPDAWCRINGSDAVTLTAGSVIVVKAFCSTAVDNISADLRVVRV